MFKNIKLSASLMCADWLNLKNQIIELESNGIDYMHYDVVDGLYAPDFTTAVAQLLWSFCCYTAGTILIGYITVYLWEAVWGLLLFGIKGIGSNIAHTV